MRRVLCERQAKREVDSVKVLSSMGRWHVKLDTLQ